MKIVDMHCDSLSCVSGARGLVTPYNFSEKERHLQFAAAFVPNDDREPAVRRAALMQHLNVFLSERERLGIAPVKAAEDVHRFETGDSHAALFSVEGGAGLFADSPELETLKAAGLAVVGMAWDTNELAASAWDKDDVGLSFLGKAFVRRCDELGIISDVSHLSDKSFYELTEISGYPILATHSNFRDVCASPRNLTRDMARIIAERGGVIGINIYPPFLRDGGEAGLDDILRHVDYALEHFGDGCLGFGFDIDGTDGEYPRGISTERSIHDQVVELLAARYPAETVERIAGGNVIEFLKNNLA